MTVLTTYSLRVAVRSTVLGTAIGALALVRCARPSPHRAPTVTDTPVSSAARDHDASAPQSDASAVDANGDSSPATSRASAATDEGDAIAVTATVAGVPVFSGHGPGHPAVSNPALFLGKNVNPSRTYAITGLYKPAFITLWSEYPPAPTLQAASAGDMMTPPNAGMDIFPLLGPLRAEPDAIVEAVLEPVVQRDKHGHELLLFAPQAVQSQHDTSKARKLALAFHERYRERLRSIEEARTRRKLPPLAQSPSLRAGFDAKSRELTFEASRAEPLGMSFSANYVFEPPYDALSRVYVSSMLLGE